MNTGLRQSELLDLAWNNVDLFRRTYYIGQQKNKGKDTLPLNATAPDVLQERARVRHINTNHTHGRAGHGIEERRREGRRQSLGHGLTTQCPSTSWRIHFGIQDRADGRFQK